jgi:type VI secretion system protein ImpL
MPENGPLGPARKWVEEMAKVRTFFAPFLDAQRGDAELAYDVEPSFRLLRKHEIDGDQVIGWSLTIGDATVTNRDKTKKLRWTPGREVELALRWAANAQRIPSAAKPQPAMSVRGRTTAAFDYTNRWSLLAALDGHRVRAEELPAYADVEPVTLVFSVPTETAVDGKPSPVAARLFVRLALLAPGSTQPVELPQFPGPAPKIEEAAR